MEVAESTWHRWLAQYGGMNASDAKRLRELERQDVDPVPVGVPGV